jgi:hypothetical protein
MLRRLLCTIACTTAAGCLDEAPPPLAQNPTAREVYDQHAWTALAACAGCHAKQPSIDFLAPGTAEGAYQSLFAFQPPVINLDVPASSLLLTMGKHTGPAMDPVNATAVLDWLEAERDERVMATGGTVHVGPFMPMHGTPQVLDLGVGGATLTIVTEASETGLYAKRITLASGSGIELSHPLFVSRPKDPILDETDRFADLDLALGAGKTIELGPAWFFTFNPADYVVVHFATLEAP